MNTAETYYRAQKSDLMQKATVLKKKRKAFGWLRLALVLALFYWIFHFWGNITSVILGVLPLLLVLLRIIALDVDTKNLLTKNLLLQQLLAEEIQTILGSYDFRKDGNVFRADSHPYAGDLDIFGEKSLFQLLTRCTSAKGAAILAARLTQKHTTPDILEWQSAVKELSSQTDFRMQLLLSGTLTTIADNAASVFEQWRQQKDLFTTAFYKVLIWIYPLVSIGMLFAYLDDRLSGGIFSGALLILLLFSQLLSRKVTRTYLQLEKVVRSAQSISDQLSVAGQMKAGESALLQRISMDLHNEKGDSAYRRLQRLTRILGRFEIRLNVFLFIILNTFLLWDVRQVLSLNRWKKENGAALLQWMERLAQLEALNSLATFAYNREDTVFPLVSEDYFTLSCTSVGHPLLAAEKRVDNDFIISGKGKIALITGSNMGGKSTFLRSLGVNMVLAFAGAPVCAKAMEVSNVCLMSSMRIADNLAESTSTFYAELKKLRHIIETVNSGEKTFVLLDEILRGTNSLDRHAGSKALMQQLLREKAVAVIATHDVELATMADSFPQDIANYHFDVQVGADETLYFDYKLKKGICQRMNAAILMRQIGIEL